MICKLTNVDFQDILTVVNDAAVVYKGRIPKDRWKVPYMPAQELEEELRRGVQFYGLKEKGTLIAAMGIQRVEDVTLIRHAYVLPSEQRKGLGQKLLKYLLGLAATPVIYVGTWKAADWAVRFYDKNGFKLVSEAEKNMLLRNYWRISDRQVETSVVLKMERQL